MVIDRREHIRAFQPTRDAGSSWRLLRAGTTTVAAASLSRSLASL